jgi:hypothetical protein
LLLASTFLPSRLLETNLGLIQRGDGMADGCSQQRAVRKACASPSHLGVAVFGWEKLKY